MEEALREIRRLVVLSAGDPSLDLAYEVAAVLDELEDQ
jgi:hypothetical protein